MRIRRQIADLLAFLFATAATIFGLTWLVWILWTTLSQGAAGARGKFARPNIFCLTEYPVLR